MSLLPLVFHSSPLASGAKPGLAPLEVARAYQIRRPDFTGPTAFVTLLDHVLDLRLNAGALVPLTVNDPTRVPDSNYQNRTGFVGRLALGVNF